MSEPVQQIIDDRYIDRRQLMLLLSQKFPAGSYSAEVFVPLYESKLPPNASGILRSGNSTDGSSSPLRH
jgi:hypothetical protein